MEKPECSELKNIVDSNNIVIVGANFCKACVMAKDMLKEKKIGFFNLDLNKYDHLQECLFESTRSHYIPQVFVNQKYIGGYTELKYLADNKAI